MINRQEAIELLKSCKNIVDLTEHEKKAMDMGVEAIERLTPQKPTIWGDGYADGVLVYDMWDCPNCEKSYEIDYDKYDYCPNCGQAIDWSDYHDD